MVFELRGLANAIKEGTTTVKETLFPEKNNKPQDNTVAADPKNLFGNETTSK